MFPLPKILNTPLPRSDNPQIGKYLIYFELEYQNFTNSNTTDF